MFAAPSKQQDVHVVVVTARSTPRSLKDIDYPTWRSSFYKVKTGQEHTMVLTASR